MWLPKQVRSACSKWKRGPKKKKKSLIKQKQHFCYRFSYHLKHCLGLGWLDENCGQTRLDLCVLPLQSSWLTFHSFLPKMLTHHLRVPGRVSAVSRATAAGKVPARQLGKWRAETDSGEQLWSWVRGRAVTWLSSTARLMDTRGHNPPPKLCHGKDQKSHSKWYKPYDLCSFCRAKKVSLAALF